QDAPSPPAWPCSKPPVQSDGAPLAEPGATRPAAAPPGPATTRAPIDSSSARLSHAIWPGVVVTIRPVIAEGTPYAAANRAISVVTPSVSMFSLPPATDALCTPTIAPGSTNFAREAANSMKQAEAQTAFDGT